MTAANSRYHSKKEAVTHKNGFQAKTSLKITKQIYHLFF